MAREENASYRSMREERQLGSSIDLTVNVLSQSAWPSYPDVSTSHSIPDEMRFSRLREKVEALDKEKLIWRIRRSPSKFPVSSNLHPPTSRRTTLKTSTQTDVYTGSMA